jgi:hypothetical protein
MVGLVPRPTNTQPMTFFLAGVIDMLTVPGDGVVTGALGERTVGECIAAVPVAQAE